jgi:hypothetical protein
VSGPMVTLQSSNCARSVLPAWPLKVISYVCGRTGITPRSRWLTLAVRVPGGAACVVTRCRVIRGLDAMAAAGPHRQEGPVGLGGLHPLLSCPRSAAPMLTRIKRARDRHAAQHSLQSAWPDGLTLWSASAPDAAAGRLRTGPLAAPAGSCRTKRRAVT